MIKSCDHKQSTKAPTCKGEWETMGRQESGKNSANSDKANIAICELEYQNNANKIKGKPKSMNKSRGVDEG